MSSDRLTKTNSERTLSENRIEIVGASDRLVRLQKLILNNSRQFLIYIEFTESLLSGTGCTEGD